MHQKLVIPLLLLLSTFLYADDTIEIYSAYGNPRHVIIEGRMAYQKQFNSVNKNDGWWQNLLRRLRQMESDEIENRQITLQLDGEQFTTQGDDEGYFSFDVHTRKALVQGNQKVVLKIAEEKSPYESQVAIFGSDPMVGIISDFDDTLTVSQVPNKIKLGLYTLFENYKQREVIAGMAERFGKILSQNPKDAPSTLFILSGSPLQLFRPIEAFLNYHDFPHHTLILKKVHGDHPDSLIDQFSYKTQKIEGLITLYPNIKWILFGDSGEKDMKVYKRMREKYPKNILEYYIRDIQSGEIKIY